MHCTDEWQQRDLLVIILQFSSSQRGFDWRIFAAAFLFARVAVLW